MPYAQIAAIAAPYILSAFQKKPEAPQYAPPPSAQMPDRSNYINQMMGLAFNPDDSLYQAAAERAQSNVARFLGRRGLAGSSVGGQMMSMSQAELANQWLSQAAERQARALGMVSGMDAQRAGMEMQNYQNQYQAQMGNYQNQLAAQQQAVAGLGGLAQAGLGIYQRHQALDQMANQRAADRQMIQGLFASPSPAAGPAPGGYGAMPALQAPSGPLFGGR